MDIRERYAALTPDKRALIALRLSSSASGGMPETLPAKEQRLIAYVVPKQKHAPLSQELREFVRTRLPEYMVPAVFVKLERLPLTANGKIDRQRLPVAEQIHDESEVVFAAAGTDVEETLTEIWAKLLHLDRVSVNDNFFDLGGHSLLMVQVHSELKRVFADRVTMVDLFTYPTIRSLAQYIEQQHETPATQSHLDRGNRQREAMSQRHRLTRERTR